jgi:putative zinc finger protein
VTDSSPGGLPVPHLDPGEVARHAAGTASPDERARVEAHLAECESCTGEVVAAWRFAGRRRIRGGWIAIGTAAAALLAGVLLWAPRPSGTGPVVRGHEPAGGGQALAIVSPVDRAVVGPDIALTWRSRPGVATYKLSVTGADGDSVWASITRDTVAQLPTSLGLAKGASYFWYVDALLAEGRGVTSGIHEFRVAP